MTGLQPYIAVKQSFIANICLLLLGKYPQTPVNGPHYIFQASSELRQIQISPTLYDQAAAMMSLLELYNWPQFSVVYTTYSGHQEFLNALHVLVLEREKLLQEDRFKRKSKVRLDKPSTTVFFC